MTRLSIVVPVFNVEPYLHRCIRSILAQTFTDFELILVDDGSSDNSGRICDEFAMADARVGVIHQKNGGPSSARNKGISRAVGEFIGFIDSDDWITEDMFDYLIKLAEFHGCDIVSSTYIYSNSESTYIQPDIEIKSFTREAALHYYLLECMGKRIADVPVCIKLFKLKLFDDVKFPDNRLYEDITTSFRLIQKSNRYIKSNKICYFYFQGKTSITRSGFKLKDFDLIHISEELVTLAEIENNEALSKLARTKSARSYFSLLAKIAMYGFAEKITTKNEIINTLTRELRKNLPTLLKSDMPIIRKVSAVLLAIHLNCLRIPIRMRRILLGKGTLT